MATGYLEYEKPGLLRDRINMIGVSLVFSATTEKRGNRHSCQVFSISSLHHAFEHFSNIVRCFYRQCYTESVSA